MKTPTTPVPGTALAEAIELHRRGKLRPARRLYRDAVAAAPNNADALELYGQACAELGDWTESARVLERALTLRPDSLVAVFNLASALKQLGRFADAETHYRRAVDLAPANAAMHAGLGTSLMHQFRAADAIPCFEAAVRIAPGAADSWVNLGQALHMAGRLDEAVTATEHASALEPPDAVTLVKLAKVLMALGRTGGAADVLRRASVHDSRSPVPLHLLGGALAGLRRFPEAIDAFTRAAALEQLALDPFVDLVATKLEIADWSGLDRPLQRIRELTEKGSVASVQVLLIEDDPALHQKAARGFSAAFDVRSPAMPARVPRTGPIRIGYVAADLGSSDHPVTRVLAGILEAHDPSRFEAHVFSSRGSTDGPVRQRIERAAHRFHDFSGRASSDLVAAARAAGIDIAIDLGGLTHGAQNLAFALRLAPVQASFLGYPGTSGARWIDYLVADASVVPTGSEQLYDERIVRLAGCCLPNDLGRGGPVTPAHGRAGEGLPEAGVVLAALGRARRITPEMFDIWMRILDRVDGSVLWLAAASETVTVNLAREARRRGVPPDRIIHARHIESHAEHVARYRLADIFLDTFPYGGHATAVDALWAGVPVVSLEGRAFPARVTGSVLRTLGLGELVASSPADYERIALGLATDAAARAALRSRLDAARAENVLYDRSRFTRGLEAAFSRMIEFARAGQPPAAFDVDGLAR